MNPPRCNDPENPNHRFLTCEAMSCTFDEDEAERRAAAIRLHRAIQRQALIERTRRLREAAHAGRIADKEGVINP